MISNLKWRDPESGSHGSQVINGGQEVIGPGCCLEFPERPWIPPFHVWTAQFLFLPQTPTVSKKKKSFLTWTNNQFLLLTNKRTLTNLLIDIFTALTLLIAAFHYLKHSNVKKDIKFILCSSKGPIGGYYTEISIWGNFISIWGKISSNRGCLKGSGLPVR